MFTKTSLNTNRNEDFMKELLEREREKLHEFPEIPETLGWWGHVTSSQGVVPIVNPYSILGQS